jgi:hypothetical protein
MVSFTLSTLVIALATLSTASPTEKRKLSENETSFALIADGYPVLSLNAIDSGVPGNLDLVFERLSAYPGTPAYINNTLLDFDVPNPPTYGENGPYSMYFQEVGDNYGITVPVTAIFDPSQTAGRKGFTVGSDGSLQPALHAALESFFACNSTLNGVDQFALKWGVFNSNGSAPYACVAARLVENKNVQ